MAREILSGDEGRGKMKKGVDTLANAVKITLGPKGRNVVISRKNGPPKITKDGVTVAKHIDLKDPIENMGAQMVKEVSIKVGDTAGDGTTTATLLTQAIISEGIKMISSGVNPIELSRGIYKAAAIVIQSIVAQSSPVGKEDIKKVAKLSANGDEGIAQIIEESFNLVGNEGQIRIEESDNMDTKVKHMKGINFERGYINHHFQNNEKGETVLINPRILIYDKKISTKADFVSWLVPVINMKESLLVIAEDVDAEAIGTMVVNRIKGGAQLCAVRLPSFGDYRAEILDDIAALVGCSVVSAAKGDRIETVEPSQMGRAEKVIVTRDDCQINGGHQNKDIVSTRLADVREKMLTANGSEKEHLQERLNLLTGGIAIIQVGGMTESEMKEKMDRVDDALQATRAAVKEGIVPGGGVTFIRALADLDKMIPKSDEERLGIEIIKKAIVQPLIQIVENGGGSGSMVVENVKNGEGDYGYNARTEKYGKLLEEGVIDPTKVVRVALESAASVGALFLTTDCVMSEIEDENPLQMLQMGGQ